jgi:hypothetical protein
MIINLKRALDQWSCALQESVREMQENLARAIRQPLEEMFGLSTAGRPEVSHVDQLAEWIFARRGKEHRFDLLYAEARRPGSGIESGLLKKDLLAAYQRVYQTKPWRSPKDGWPLQPEFQHRIDRKSLAKSPPKSPC